MPHRRSERQRIATQPYVRPGTLTYYVSSQLATAETAGGRALSTDTRRDIRSRGTRLVVEWPWRGSGGGLPTISGGVERRCDDGCVMMWWHTSTEGLYIRAGVLEAETKKSLSISSSSNS
jgi:hypothetical protein